VEAAFTEAGEITPQRFQWQGHWLEVEGLGGRWTEAGQRCIRVAALGGMTFELRLDLETLRWSIVEAKSPRPAV
jgi:hypothetical protein